METRYDSARRRCRTPIEPGDQILYDGEARHVACPDVAYHDAQGDLAHAAPRAPTERPTRSQVGSLSAALALFDGAREHLRYPKVRLQTDEGREIVLSVAGPQSRYPGALNVADDLGFDDPSRAWYGRIDRDGSWIQAERAPGDVRAIVAAFAAEPAKVAAEYGRLTGACCFCGRRLTDERSTTVGYGPVCADHYELLWGN